MTRCGRSRSVAFTYLHPFCIIIIVLQQMFSRVWIVFADRADVPTIVNWPEDANFFPNHTVGAEPGDKDYSSC